MDRSEVAIIIPAFNEIATIERVVRGASRYGKVVVIDDGSRDATQQTAERAGAIVVRHYQNRGYDEALNSGFQWAAQNGVTYAITVDADGQNDPDVLQRFLDELRFASVVIGVRDRKQRFAEHIMAFVYRILYGISDPLCGMKGYDMAVFHRVGHFDCYRSFGTELALYAARNGYPIRQIPVHTHPRKDESRMGSSLKVNLAILRICFVSVCRTIHQAAKPS
jgi:glycosyltransferase involved in cell wall biosynthesis